MESKKESPKKQSYEKPKVASQKVFEESVLAGCTYYNKSNYHSCGIGKVPCDTNVLEVS